MSLPTTVYLHLGALDLSGCGGTTCTGGDTVQLDYAEAWGCYMALDVCVAGYRAAVYLYWDDAGGTWYLDIELTGGNYWGASGPDTSDDPTNGGSAEYRHVQGTCGNDATVTVSTS